MPSGAVRDHGGMDVFGQPLGDFVQQHLHSLRIGVRKDKADGRVPFRAESPEYVRVGVARVDRKGRTRAFGRPRLGAAPFLSDARFVLAPKFDLLVRMRVLYLLDLGL